MLILQWEYLLGKAAAGEWHDRAASEWPPHPDRAFQALVAAWGHSGRNPAEEKALRWLEQQPPPDLAFAGDALPCSERTVFVPVNDLQASPRTRSYSANMHALLPMQRKKAARQFAATTVDTPVALIWPNADPDVATLEALRTLCAQVTHVGQDTSFVRMWTAEQSPTAMYAPSDTTFDFKLRVPHAGRFDTLVAAYANGGGDWQRPPVARWQGYADVTAAGAPPPAAWFGEDWSVWRRVAGTTFSLAQSPAVADALRQSLIKAADGDSTAMTLLAGHNPDGSKLERPHVAYVPLGFVDHPHADGHLLGIALVLPRGISYAERDACLRALVKAGDPESGAIQLNFGRAGTLTMLPEEREQPPFALRPESWCRQGQHWASVTPIALDRLPPRRHADPERWAADQVAQSCERIGLPRPTDVRILPVSRFTGAPDCRAFTPLKRRHDGGPRRHVHAELTFAEPVRGPLLLGAGRYRGYGICRPFHPERICHHEPA